MSSTDLPAWVWDLIDALDAYEEEHPLLYMNNWKSQWVRTECFGKRAEGIIPAEIRDAARLARQRLAAATS